MISILAFWLAAVNPAAEVKNLSVAPASGRTEVVIRMDSEVSVKPMFLSEGNRLVLDLTTAQQPTGLDFQVNRGGVVGLRIRQFQPGVVRVVLDLAVRVDYKVDTSNGEVRVFVAPFVVQANPCCVTHVNLPVAIECQGGDRTSERGEYEPPAVTYTWLVRGDGGNRTLVHTPSDLRLCVCRMPIVPVWRWGFRPTRRMCLL